MRRRRALVLGLLAAAVLVGCSNDVPTAADPAPPSTAAADPQPGRLRPSEPFGVTSVRLRPPGGTPVRLAVYDAATAQARARGLMFRTALPSRAGMVFRFPEPSSSGFWMKNTLIPLSIAYFAGDGEILAVLDMEPCPDSPCRHYDPGVEYQGALEVNQGLFERLGVEPGWSIDLPEGLAPPE